jgi:acyl-CoA thioesterase
MSTASSAWVLDLTGRPPDHVQLAYLADSYAPRIFFHSDGPRASATMTLSIYFHGSPEEIAAVGDGYVLNEAVGTRASSSISGQHARLWNASGALLATTEQLCWFRET